MKTRLRMSLAALAWLPVFAFAQFEIEWSTIDGGGAMFSTGGAYEMGGSIGQPDAGSFAQPMSGGTFELTGGFWGAARDACAGFTLGDCDCDGDVDSFDISAFVLALTSPGAFAVAFPGCDRLCVADIDEDLDVDSFDIAPFVACLTGGGCP